MSIFDIKVRRKRKSKSVHWSKNSYLHSFLSHKMKVSNRYFGVNTWGGKEKRVKEYSILSLYYHQSMLFRDFLSSRRCTFIRPRDLLYCFGSMRQSYLTNLMLSSFYWKIEEIHCQRNSIVESKMVVFMSSLTEQVGLRRKITVERVFLEVNLYLRTIKFLQNFRFYLIHWHIWVQWPLFIDSGCK